MRDVATGTWRSRRPANIHGSLITFFVSGQLHGEIEGTLKGANVANVVLGSSDVATAGQVDGFLGCMQEVCTNLIRNDRELKATISDLFISD